MAERANWHSVATEPRKRITRTFSEPGMPDFTVQLEEPDALTDYLATEVSMMLRARYIEGDEALEMPPEPFMVNGQARQLTQRLCDDAGLIVAMQPDPWDLDFPRFEPEEILQMALKARIIWRDVKRLVWHLYYAAEDALPNASGAHGESSSPRRSSAAPSIPASSNTSAGESGSSRSEPPAGSRPPLTASTTPI